MRAGLSEAEAFQLTKIDPWFLRNLKQMVDADEAVRIDGAKRGAAVLEDGAALLRLEAARHVGPAPDEADQHQRGAGAAGAAQVRRPAGVQARRHLRRRVRGADAVPVFHLRGRLRGERRRRRVGRERRTPDPEEEDRDPGRRPQPHRPGDRVRLLLRARRAGAARGRVRDHHGQLQPGDGVDRLRHLRPAVLRAAHARGRAGDHRRREAGRASSSSSAGRRRCGWRCR